MHPPHLTQKDTDDLLKFFTLARAHLRMDQWDIIIMNEPCDKEDDAEVTPQDNYFCAQVRINEKWAELPPFVKKDVVIHELLHLLHRELTDLWQQVTFQNKGMSESDAGLFQNFWFVSVERMVGHLSKIIADGWDQQWPAPSKTVVGKGISVQGEHR